VTATDQQTARAAVLAARCLIALSGRTAANGVEVDDHLALLRAAMVGEARPGLRRRRQLDRALQAAGSGRTGAVDVDELPVLLQDLETILGLLTRDMPATAAATAS
jgi:hypothetical protein